MVNQIPKQTLLRLPLYLSYLKSLPKDSPDNISATSIANGLMLNHVQVRKDLAMVSSSGKPKIGYITHDLIEEIECFLGYDNINNAIIVGAGRLGTALLTYDGFKAYGLEIIAAFDSNQNVANKTIGNKQILPINKLQNLCERLNVHIGIITAPSECAQEICDLLVKSGILAIWNFAPVHLIVPKHILVQNENMATALAVLSNHLSERLFDKAVKK